MIELVLFTAFIVINCGIYSLLFYKNEQQFSANLIKSFTFFYLQIFLIQVILGLTGYLETKYFLSTNTLILILLLFFLYFKRREKVKEIFVKIKLLKSKTKSNIKPGFEEIFILSEIIASLFCIAVVLRASYFFPPRGIDDILYHMPRVLENVLEKKFVKIPPELHPGFGFPFSGQFLVQTYAMIF